MDLIKKQIVDSSKLLELKDYHIFNGFIKNYPNVYRIFQEIVRKVVNSGFSNDKVLVFNKNFEKLNNILDKKMCYLGMFEFKGIEVAMVNLTDENKNYFIDDEIYNRRLKGLQFGTKLVFLKNNEMIIKG